MAHVEPMDVDTISNDFDDKENLLQNSNVLPKTPSTEKGYEELDVSELNMKLRYSMTPATSPMSRSFTTNCRDSKVCDNENNLINNMFNDNSILSHSFNSTITDSIFKSSKFPLQVLPTEQFVDDNGNPINRSQQVDVECNNITITVNGTDNIDDNLSLPSTSSSLIHTPEATTPTKEIVKDGGSPIMRGLKSVLNMFRSSQSPIPIDDITTNDHSTSECQKNEDISKFITNLESTPATTSKNKEKILKTNNPLKESIVFNEDLEKELLWKDETTILFKEEKIPVYKLFFPSNPAALEDINSKPKDKESMNTTVEYMDGSFNENVKSDKDRVEVVKLSHFESETLNSQESDSEFVDCETSYTKNHTEISDDDILALAPIIKNMSSEFFITNENEKVEDENSSPVAISTDLAIESNEIISNIHDVIKGNIYENFKQTCNNDFPIMKESLNQSNISINSIKEDNLNGLSNNSIVNDNVSDLVQYSDESFNFEKHSENIDSQITKEYYNCIINSSDIVDNNVTLCDKVKEDDVKGFYPQQITKDIEKNCSGELVCNLESPLVLNKLVLDTDVLKINNIKLLLDSQDVNELNINLGVAKDQIITKDKNMPFIECEKVFNVNNNCSIQLDSDLREHTILEEKHNNKIDTFSDQIIHLESKEVKPIKNNLPSDIPLPYDSDIDKDKLQDINEKYLKENNKSVNISSNNLNFDLSYSTESFKQSINGMTSLAEIHSETISYPPTLFANTLIIQTSQLELSDDMSNITKDIKANEGGVLNTEINNTHKCISTVKADTKEISSKIADSAIFPLNNNYSVNELDLDVLTHHTQDNQKIYSQNNHEFVKTSKPTDVEDEIVSKIDVEVQYDDVRFSSTNCNTLETGTELGVLRHDSEDSENLFETKNKLIASLEVQHFDNVTRDVFQQNNTESMTIDANNIPVKYEEIENPVVNINTSVIEMDLDVTKHDSENSVNPIKSRTILITSPEIPDPDSDVEGIIGTKYIESVNTILINKNEITIKPDNNIKEDVNIPSNFDNSLVTKMELDVSMLELGETRSLNDFKEEFKSSDEEQGRESSIEDMNAKGFENTSLDDYKEVTTANDFNINEVRSTYSTKSVTEMKIDVSNTNLEDSRNPINIKGQFTSSFKEQGCESVNSKFENKCFYDYKEITNENEFKSNEVISIPTKNNDSLTEMVMDVSKHDLIASENIIKAPCRDRDIEDCESVKNNFENVPTLSETTPSERVEITSKSDVTINDTLIFSCTTNISSKKDLGVSRYGKNTLETKGLTPPRISSEFTQDCYSINRDEIDDPFTTDSNSLAKPNRNDILHDEQIYNVAKVSTRASLDCVLNSNMIVNSCEENRDNYELYVKDSEQQDYIENNMGSAPSTSDKLQDNIECNMLRNCSFSGKAEMFVKDAEINLNNKISSSEIYKSKNVFNLPEINDMNFNTFETTYKADDNEKTSSDVDFNPLEQTNVKSARTEAEKSNMQDLESNLSPNLSNVTCSSKNTDDITLLREVHTEDEDTIEGPFLEADDFSDIVKVADFKTDKDLMNFEDMPKRTNNDNENGEFFIDAEAFEFLLNQNKSNVVADSGKESLFLKFDPLFAKRISSDGVLAALNKIQKRQSTPKKLTPSKVMHEESPIPGPSTTTPIGLAAPVGRDIVEEPVGALSKPMMVVNPAIASTVSPKKSATPARANRRSLTFTSPAMAVIDRLLSLSGNSSSLDQDTSLPPSRDHNETDFALTQLRELLAEKEIHVHNLRSESKELKERFAILETQVRSLEVESEERLRKVKELNEHLAEKNKINKSMAIVVEEYERTIASLIAEMEQEKKQNAEERRKLISERDEQTAHLTSMEVSFSDLHSKYEKSKQIILSMKANEDTYKKSLNEFEVNLLKMQTNYDLLKQHATSKLNHANQELEKYNRTHDAEVLKLNAMIKRKELHITSLEESLSQKTKANEELTAICDELINKVG